jgi:hypothetical protein
MNISAKERGSESVVEKVSKAFNQQNCTEVPYFSSDQTLTKNDGLGVQHTGC